VRARTWSGAPWVRPSPRRGADALRPLPKTIGHRAKNAGVKRVPAYLDETAFRFNNRDNPYLFRDTLLKLIGAENLPYEQLVSDSN
jgi:hypothetical protein